MKIYYLHTLDGKPAYFDGQQVCFVNYRGKAAPLAKNLAQIRKEQQMSDEWREKQGYRLLFDSSHIRVAVPE